MTVPTIACLVMLLGISAGESTTQDREPAVQPQDPRGIPTTVGDDSLRMYDVVDLFDPKVGDFRRGEDRGDEKLEERAARAYRELAELVAARVQPRLAEGQVLRVTERGTLIALLESAQHEWVQSFLDLQRRSTQLFYDLQFRVISLPVEESRRLGFGKGAQTLDVEPGKLMEKLMDTAGVDVMNAPRLLVLNRQHANLSVLDQVAYVSGYEVYERVEPRAARIVDPIVDVVQEGMTVDCRVVRIGEDLCAVEFEFVLAEVERPIVVVPTQYGEICTPVVTKRTISSEVVLGDGMMVAFPGLLKEDREVTVLLHLKQIEPEPFDESEPEEPAEPRERRRAR